ncbi:MAG TPA: hypothetical protein VMS43_00525 [Allosphingosinicella sp.]|nr:hypothetical protein [Allosphingosinicella sp.]
MRGQLLDLCPIKTIRPFPIGVFDGRYSICLKASDQGRYPIGGLHRLVKMAFHLKRRLDQAPGWFASKHSLRCSFQQLETIRMLIQDHHELLIPVATISINRSN